MDALTPLRYKFCRHGPTGLEATDVDARLVGDAGRMLRTDAEQRGQLRSPCLYVARREERLGEAGKASIEAHPPGKSRISVVYVTVLYVLTLLCVHACTVAGRPDTAAWHADSAFEH